MPELKKGWPTGMLGLRPDKDGNMWLGMMYQGAIAKFDLKDKKFTTWSMPPEMQKDQTQVNMVRAEQSHVDGKVWSQNNGFAAIHRLDLKTGQIESLEPFKAAGVGETHNIYDIIPDFKNNAYFTDIAAEYIGKVDKDTMKVTLFQMPKKPAGPRRGMMDEQDRIWFGEYRGNRIGMFDTKTETFKEWDLPTPWSNPYDVALDKNEQRLDRLDDQRPRRAARHQDRPVHRVPAAEDDQHPARLRRQHHDAAHVLGRQQPRRQHHQARDAGLNAWLD